MVLSLMDRLLLLLFGFNYYYSLGARYQTVGSENDTQYIQLKSQYDLLPNSKLLLPIDVPDEYIGLFGAMPPRLKSIFSSMSTGFYGTSSCRAQSQN